MSLGLPDDPIFDPVGIVVWSVDTGIFDIMYSAWGWPVVEIVHFTGLCLLMGTVGMFDLRMLGLVRGLPLAALHRLVPFGVFGFGLSVGSGVMFVTSTPPASYRTRSPPPAAAPAARSSSRPDGSA